MSVSLPLLQAVGNLAETPDQPNLLEARQMQALSLGWHILIVPFGVTFPAIMAFAELLYLRTGDPLYRTLARRWSQAMIILFAVGAVSGTILSFELGILWPNWMAVFGDVFGLAFTLEGFAFFIEAIFITIYLYTWDRLPPKIHFLTAIPIVIAGHLGALFVIAVNGWMNSPTGFEIVNGEVTNVQPWKAIFGNGAVWPEYVHMVLAAYMVAGFVTAAVYAWAWLRGKRERYFRVAFMIPFTLAALVTPAQLVVGDAITQFVATDQPVKLAAIEGLGKTEAEAPIVIFGTYSYEDMEVNGGIEIPNLLSILAFHDPDAVVTGLDAVPEEDQPPVNTVRYAFHAMVAAGTALFGLAAWYALVLWRRKRLPTSRLFYWSAVAAGPLVCVALLSGWITTEVGRQPWVVYEVMRTRDAVTSASGLEWGLVTLVVVYAALTVGAIYALRVLARRPLPGPTTSEPAAVGPGTSSVGEARG